MIRIVLYSGDPGLTEMDFSNSIMALDYACVFESTSLHYSSRHLPGVFTEVTWNVLFLQFKIVTAQQMIIVYPNLSQLIMWRAVVSSAATFNSATEYVNLCSHTEIACMPRDGNWPRLIDLGLVTFIQSTYWIATNQWSKLAVYNHAGSQNYEEVQVITPLCMRHHIYCNGTNKQVIIHDGMLIVLWVHTEIFWASNIFQIPATGNLTLG